MRLCYDSTNPLDIPVTAALVAGYVDGIYGPNHAVYGQPGWDAAAWARFPNSIHVRIACFATTNDGHVLDVETGDATPGQAPHWALMRRAAGIDPTCYVNRSNLAAVLAAFDQQGVARPHIWLSTLDNSQPWAPGIMAIQYAGSNLSGGHYDLSAVADYWPGVDPIPTPQEVPRMFLIQSSEVGADKNPLVYAVGESGKRHLSGAEFAAAKAAGFKPEPMAAADVAAIPDATSPAPANLQPVLDAIHNLTLKAS